MPGGKPDVVTTAIGLMAASELKIADPAMIKAAVDYLGKNAKSFEEVRMAIAGLEAVHGTSPDFSEWNEMLQGMRNPDGTLGEGPGQAYATGGAGAAILRMGLKLDKRDAVVAALKAGQRPEGGWSKDDGPARPGRDLPHHAGPVHAAREARHRAIADVRRPLPPVRRQLREQAGRTRRSLGGTYTATIVIYWVRHLLGMPAVVETAGFTPLVNGKDLTGWEGDTKLWSNKDGVLIGHSPGLNHNEFLATTRDLWRLRPLALLPDDRRQGQQRRPVSQHPHSPP